jgi:hypothetical protein
MQVAGDAIAIGVPGSDPRGLVHLFFWFSTHAFSGIQETTSLWEPVQTSLLLKPAMMILAFCWPRNPKQAKAR